MKKILPFLFVLIGFSSSAQIVNIPDPVFKNVLVNYADLLGRTIDTNGDGEIQYSEAASFSSIDGGYWLQIAGKNISDLTGIQAFTSLKTLLCEQNNLSGLDVSGMTLKDIYCQNNNISSINISGCGATLQTLACSNNQLSSIDLTGQASLKTLFLSNNNLSSLDLSGAPLLNYLECAQNHLTTLDASLVPLAGLDCSNNQLTYLNVKNGQFFNYSSNAFTNFSCLENPGLQYICADDQEILFLLEYFVQNNIYGMQIDPNCSFSTSSGYSTVNGVARIDFDNNGCSPSDPVKSAMKLKLIKDNDTLQQLSKTTDTIGEYNFYTYVGDHTVIPTLQNPYYTINPDTLHFTAIPGTTQNLNFCITPNGSHVDLDIKMNYLVAFIDGTCHTYITYKNKGTETMSGNVQLIFDDNKLDFLSSSTPISNQSTGMVTWDFSNLQPFETRVIEDISLYLLPPPVNNINDTLTFTANVNPVAPDETPADNTFTLRGPVTYVVIPISIEYFKGAIQAGKHLLNWKANCTSLQAVFNIERSTDSRKYSSIGSITASNTRCLQPFDFTDDNPATGMNYYRIKMTDMDGKISYSSVIALLNKKTGFEIVNLLPNPVTAGTALLNITAAEKQTISIIVSDASGKTVQSMDQPVISGFTQIKMNFSKLAAGIYTIAVHTNDGERRIKQFVKQ